MTQPLQTVNLNLADNDVLGSIPVELESFDRFEEQFDFRIEQLVAKWQHLASPNAGVLRRSPVAKSNT